MYPKGEVGPNKSGRTTINTGRQFSFDTSQNCRVAIGAHCTFGAHVWRRVAGAAATTTSFSVGLDYLLARVWTI
jgi:hypothetical protein